MITFDKFDIQRTIVSATAALAVSALCVLGAAGPAHAEQTGPANLAEWQSVVNQQIDRELRMPANALSGRNHAVAAVRVTLDPSGQASDIRVARSAGDRQIDKEAVRVAKAISYPALPATLSNRSRTVELQLYFGNARSAMEADKHSRAIEQMAKAAEAHDTAILAGDNGVPNG